jgi:hypothetical protein
MKSHPHLTTIALSIVLLSLFAQVIAEEASYEESDGVEIDEPTTTGFSHGDKSSASPSSLPPQTHCDDPQRCKNIDEVWANRIGQFINQEHAQDVWDPYSKTWKTFKEVYAPPLSSTSSTSSTPSSSSDPLKFPGSGKCLEMAIVNSAAERAQKVKPVTFQGTEIKVHPLIIPLIKKIDQEITAEINKGTITYNFKKVSAGSWRCVNSPKVTIVDQNTCLTSKGRIARSKHSYGIAIDINPKENPFCEPSCSYNLPQKVIDIFKQNDFRWGGDWDGAKDYMHFDWKGNLGDFNGDGVLELCGTSSSIPAKTSPESAYSTNPTPAPAGKAWEQYTASETWADALTEVPEFTGDTQIWKSPYNGKDDNLNRIDTGRDAILFFPSITTASKPIDIIYYFHGQGGFGLDMSERVLPQAKALADKGHNFVIVFPELPWSRGTFEEAKSNRDNPRIKTSGRQSLAWDGSDSDFAQFHQEVINKISSKYGIMYPKRKIYIIGHSNGGSAIGKAAEKGAFNSVKPDVITFSDADYHWGAKTEAQEVYDNYLKSNPTAELNLVMQAPSEPSNHQPTKYAIQFLKENSFSLTDKNTPQHFNPNINYVPITQSKAKSTVINVEQDSKRRPSPESGLHGMIGRMSIYWTVTHNQNLEAQT